MRLFSAKYWIGWAVIVAGWVIAWATSPGPSDTFYDDPTASDFNLGSYSITAAIAIGVWTWLCWRWDLRHDRRASDDELRDPGSSPGSRA